MYCLYNETAVKPIHTGIPQELNHEDDHMSRMKCDGHSTIVTDKFSLSICHFKGRGMLRVLGLFFYLNQYRGDSWSLRKIAK
jgi:hypothetical protein